MRNSAPRIGRPRRHDTMVNQQAVESKLGFIGHRKNSLSISSRGKKSRRPSQNLPPTAIYCHFVAAKPLHPLEPFHSYVAPRGVVGRPRPRAENRRAGQ